MINKQTPGLEDKGKDGATQLSPANIRKRKLKNRNIIGAFMRELQTGNIRSHILHLSWPMMIANMLLNIAGAFELYLLGKISLEALAAYSIIISSVFELFMSVHGGIVNGAIAVVSRYSGSKRRHEVGSVIFQMLIVSFMAYALYSVVILMFSGQILEFFGAKGDALKMAREYTFILVLSSIPMTVFSVGLGALRGAGDSVTPLKVTVAMSAVQIILNPILIFGFNMGLKGAAITGLCMDFTGMVIFLFIFIKGKHFVKVGLTDLKIRKDVLVLYIEIAVKAILQNFVFDIGLVIMLKIVSGYGNAYIAAYGIVTRIGYFLGQIGWPIGNSGGTIIGHTLGVKDRARAMSAVTEGTKIFLIVIVPAMFAYFLLPAQVLRVFTDNAEALKYGIVFMRIMALSLPFFGAGIIVQAAFNGAGALGTSVTLNFITYVLVRIGLAAGLPLIPGMGQYGVFWAISLSLVFYGVVYWWYYRTGKWMEKVI
jgi:putative MATE family efflux protein